MESCNFINAKVRPGVIQPNLYLRIMAKVHLFWKAMVSDEKIVEFATLTVLSTISRHHFSINPVFSCTIVHFAGTDLKKIE